MKVVIFESSCVSLENLRIVELNGYSIIFHYSTRTPIYYETYKKQSIPKGGEFETVTVRFKTIEEAKENFEKVKKALDK